MMLVELTPVPSAALPIAALSDHLRLSSGFADDGSQNARLESCLRAAAASIEARTAKALFQRGFVLTLSDGWSAPEGQPLPVAPVASVDRVSLISPSGGETILGSETYRLVQDTHRPRIAPMGSWLPSPVQNGSVEIELTAGFGADWSGIPADLQEALLSLAAEFYNQETGTMTEMPGPVAMLIERYRQIRLGGARA